MNRPVPVSPFVTSPAHGIDNLTSGFADTRPHLFNRKRTQTQLHPHRPSTLHHQETNSSTSSTGSDLSTDDPSRNPHTPGPIPFHHLPTPALAFPPTSSPQPQHTPHPELQPFSLPPQLPPLPPHHLHGRRISPVLPSLSDPRPPSILIPFSQRPPPHPLPPASAAAAAASALPTEYNQYTPGGGGSEMMNPMSIAAALVATARHDDNMMDLGMDGPSHGPGQHHTGGLGSGSARSGSSGTRYYHSSSHSPNNLDDVGRSRGIPSSRGRPPPIGSNGGGAGGSAGGSNHSSRHSSGSPRFSRQHHHTQQQRQHYRNHSQHEQPYPRGLTEQEQQAQRQMQQHGRHNLSPEDTRHIVEQLRGLGNSLHRANSEQRKLVDETMREWGSSDDAK